MKPEDLTQLTINTIRFLSADAVQKADSGHPGLPMGCAAIAYTIWTRHLKFDPGDPAWPDRDRFVLSPGHGSMLLYSLLHLAGYDLSLDDLKNFRQWGSPTPGHPEFGHTPGVETTTGPLGQGMGNAVGMAMAAAHLEALYNRPRLPLIDHFIYAIVSDGDLMEGISHEAASFAGHQQLGRLICLYDDNRISIDGSTDLTYTEDRAARFLAYGWQVLQVADGNDVEAIDQAIRTARDDPRPSLIICRTQIGYGLPTRQGTAKAHGEPPGTAELRAAKEQLGWPLEPDFHIPPAAAEHFAAAAARGQEKHAAWRTLFGDYQQAEPALGAQFKRTIAGDLPADLEKSKPAFQPDPRGMATRASSGLVLNALAAQLPEFFGGSADLTGSNKTDLTGEGSFQPGQRAERYIYYGVREHGMAAIMNGIALHGGLIPYGGTFLVFSDYMRPSMRLAAMMRQRVIYVLTHDSIGLGEDGPTHQPIEHLAALRSIPGMRVLRPADANETAEAWIAALRFKGPTVLALTRQALPTLDRSRYAPAAGLQRGAYVLADLGEVAPQLILIASGSEVPIIVQAGEELAAAGLGVRLVSMPSWELFAEQEAAYRQAVLPPSLPIRLAVEAGVSQGWERWVGPQGLVLGIDHFGASAPYEQIYEQFGLTSPRVAEAARRLLESASSPEVLG